MMVQQPSLLHQWWFAVAPHRTLCLALEAGLHPKQLIESKALFQYDRP